MTLVTATNQENIDALWEFSQMDLNCLQMVIKGQWVFGGTLDETEMRKSLSRVLQYYPHLSGRMLNDQGIIMNNSGVPFHVVQMNNMKIADIQRIKNPLDFFNAGLNLSDFMKGKIAPLSIQLTQLADGSVLNIHSAHVCVDGHGFFGMMNNWSKLHHNERIDEPILSLESNFFSQPYSREEAIALAKVKKWKPVGFVNLLQLIWQKITKIPEVASAPIYVSHTQISALKQKIEKERGQKCSTNTIISALATKLCQHLNGFNESKKYAQITVMDLRGRIAGIDPKYAGNAVTTIATPEFQSNATLAETVTVIDRSIKSLLAADSIALQEHVKLMTAAAIHKIPFLPFDLRAMNSPKPTCVYTNNQLKFPIYDLDFGCGKPILAFPNDLPDAVKFWPSNPQNPGVDIYLRGYLANRYNKLKNKGEWLDTFFKHTV